MLSPDAAALLPGASGPARRVHPGPGGPRAAGDDEPLTAGGHGPTVAVSPAHNQVALWAWGEHDSWLRAGATTAVLADGWTDPADQVPSAPRSLTLQAGDVVVFEATAGPVRDRAARPQPNATRSA